MNDPIHRRIALLFPGRYNGHYVPSKLRRDPLYEAIYQELRNSASPLLDLGCGLGLLAFFLREKGLGFPITSLDYDARKIDAARTASARSGAKDLVFRHHDARGGLPDHHGNVTILDILQFFTAAEQEALLRQAVERTAPGGKLLIRSGLRDASIRFRITVLGDVLAKVTLWMKSGPIRYPTAGDFQRILSSHGRVRICPLWGGTPFNNHLIVLDKNG